MTLKFSKCSDWLNILHRQRLGFVGFDNNIHNGVARGGGGGGGGGRSTMEGLEHNLPKMTYNTISREPI